MTKRRDRNRAARRRKPKRIIIHWTDGTAEERHAALVAQIAQTLNPKRSNRHD